MRRPRLGRFHYFAVCTAIALAGVPAVSEPAEAASGTAAMVVDAHTGRTIHARNADAPRYPASLTKVMTLYVVFDRLRRDRLKMDTPLSVSANAAAQVPSKVGVRAGQTINVRDAIGVLMTRSANDVAVVVAENLAGSEASFARLMTETARRIGMPNTTFRNASGLPNSEQVTTARDMVTMARRVMEDFPEYYGLFSRTHYTYAGTRYRSHNRLLTNYSGTDGIKTGFTRASGFNLLASVRRNDRHLIGVVMGGNTAASRDAHMRRILDQSFPQAVAHRAPAPLPDRNPRVLASSERPGFAAASVTGTLPARREARQPATASAEPVPARLEEGDATVGGFHVQVGAYASQSDARARLVNVQGQASDLLSGHAPITTSFTDGTRALYRARFADFTEADARAVCSQLTSRDINCVVMPAQ